MALRVWLPLNKDIQILPVLSTSMAKESGISITEENGWFKIADASHTSNRWGAYMDFEVEPGLTYILSCDLKAGTRSAKVGFDSFAGSRSWPTDRITSSSTTGERKSYTLVTARGKYARVYFNLAPTALGDYAYFKNPTLTKITNLGISNINITEVSTSAINENTGKIGKCLTDNGTAYWAISPITLGSNCSICCWTKTSINGKMSWVLESNANATLNLYESTYYALNIGDGNSNLFKDNNGNSITCLHDGKWHHFVVTFDGTSALLYIDGEYRGKAITFRNPTTTNGRIKLGGGYNNSHSYDWNGDLNDIRIYDHCLSPLEVKEISQGLVLHYKLNQNLQILDNCYSYPTFDTSSANGGWSHWGRSGHVGNQGQNTDKTYIYNKQNTYSHWVSNDSTATVEYLVYQSPAFDGGYRSLQAIIKEENSKPIDETICFPDWNARNGGTPIGLWTSIVSLGDGFYLCKCEGISQDGSNDLVGIYVKPGYKIYLSEAYLENDKETCSEILYPRNYVIDSSGYGNDGSIIGNTLIQSNSPRYNTSIHMNNVGTTNHIEYNALSISGAFTISFWVKAALSKNQVIFVDNGHGYEFGILNNLFYTSTTTSNGWATSKFLTNNWNHIAIRSSDGMTVELFVNGVQETSRTGAGNNYLHNQTNPWLLNRGNNSSYAADASLSDFRIYTTALSAEDITTLYHTPAQIDNLGGIHGFELEEKQGNMFAVSPLAGSLTWDSENNYYVITSQPNTSNWGIGPSVGVTPKKIIPWGYSYRLSYEVYSPTAATWYVDYNNNTIDVTLSGNDNDTGRIVTGIAVPANKWTLITLGCSNTNSTKNPDHLPLYDYSSGLGPVMTNISSPITWYMRNPQWYLVDIDESTNFQVYENGVFKTNFLKEDNLNNFASFRKNEKATWGVNLIEK